MRPLPPYAALGRMYDRVEHAEPTSRLVIEEVAQLLGFDAADVLSISITPTEVAVIALGREGIRPVRTLRRSVIL